MWTLAHLSLSTHGLAQSGGRAIIGFSRYWAVGFETRRRQEHLYEMGAQPNRCPATDLPDYCSHLAFSFGGPAADLLGYWMFGSASNVKYQQSSSRYMLML